MCKLEAKASVKINAYEVMARAVEEGVSYGTRRAFKHTDTPSLELIEQEVQLAVLNSLCEVFGFDTEG